MTSALHYEPVEGERLEFDTEIYRTDDTAQIFGDDSRIPIGLREILVDPRLNPSKRIICCGAASTLVVILCVVLLFILGGYFHVQSEIKERRAIARNGLLMLPELSSDGGWMVFINLKTEAEAYAKQIKDYIDKYEEEQDSRSNFTRDCKPEDRPNGKTWCRFPTKKRFIRAGKGCTADDKYGFTSRAPCILIQLKDRIGWEPKFKENARAVNDIPFKCMVMDTFKLYDEHLNISYYPAHDLNANYGAFSLNKLPSKMITTQENEEIASEDGETLYDQPTLLFVKFHLPDNFQHGLVQCLLMDTLPGAEITNLEKFRGIADLRFDIVT